MVVLNKWGEEMEKNMRTSYVSIDKPQYKFYRESSIREFDTNQTIYELIFDSNMRGEK